MSEPLTQEQAETALVRARNALRDSGLEGDDLRLALDALNLWTFALEKLTRGIPVSKK